MKRGFEMLGMFGDLGALLGSGTGRIRSGSKSVGHTVEIQALERLFVADLCFCVFGFFLFSREPQGLPPPPLLS